MTLNVARIAGVLALAALLGGCGFHPLYASNPGGGGGTARDVFASIYVDPIAGERIGYE